MIKIDYTNPAPHRHDYGCENRFGDLACGQTEPKPRATKPRATKPCMRCDFRYEVGTYSFHCRRYHR